ncbi:MAG: LmbE family protein [Planctomyces sp.]|nr:LmbE family protein [Planctomyces sp.]
MSVELPEPLDLIAVGAHPDDVEIACGGTLAKMVQQGYRVGIVDLTDGEPTPGSPSPDVRLAEARKAAEILGVQVRETLNLANRRLFDDYAGRVELAKVFRRYRPKVVMGIAGKTPLASPDHLQAANLTDAAIFYSRLSKWDDQFDHLPVHRISGQVWYPLGLRTLSHPEGDGQFVMDISDTLDVKIKSVQAYETQFPPERADVFTMMEGMALHLGACAGFRAGELFLTPRIIGTSDLMQTVLS